MILDIGCYLMLVYFLLFYLFIIYFVVTCLLIVVLVECCWFMSFIASCFDLRGMIVLLKCLVVYCSLFSFIVLLVGWLLLPVCLLSSVVRLVICLVVSVLFVVLGFGW